jgi:hypothetical protein
MDWHIQACRLKPDTLAQPIFEGTIIRPIRNTHMPIGLEVL